MPVSASLRARMIAAGMTAAEIDAADAVPAAAAPDALSAGDAAFLRKRGLTAAELDAMPDRASVDALAPFGRDAAGRPYVGLNERGQPESHAAHVVQHFTRPAAADAPAFAAGSPALATEDEKARFAAQFKGMRSPYGRL